MNVPVLPFFLVNSIVLSVTSRMYCFCVRMGFMFFAPVCGVFFLNLC